MVIRLGNTCFHKALPLFCYEFRNCGCAQYNFVS